MATLSGINPELYEAASIDGADRWQRMKFITIPALMIHYYGLNLKLSKVMNLFESVFVLQIMQWFVNPMYLLHISIHRHLIAALYRITAIQQL